MTPRRPASLQFGLGTDPGFALDRRGAFATVESDDAIRQSIMMILLTRPGERVMRPQFGSDLHTLVFAPMDETTAGIANHLARQAVARWEPRVKVVRAESEFDSRAEAGTQLRIRLVYEVRSNGEVGSVSVPIGP